MAEPMITAVLIAAAWVCAAGATAALLGRTVRLAEAKEGR